MDPVLSALIEGGMTAEAAGALIESAGLTEAGMRHATADRARLDEVISLLLIVRDGDEAAQARARRRLAAAAAAEAEADDAVEPTDPKASADAVSESGPEAFAGTVIAEGPSTLYLEADDDLAIEHDDIVSLTVAEAMANNQWTKGRALGAGKAVQGKAKKITREPKGKGKGRAIAALARSGAGGKAVSAAAKRLHEAGESFTGALLEAIEPDGSVVDVLIIQAGMSQNRRRYEPAVLREAVSRGAFEGARSFAPRGGDHFQDGKFGMGRGPRELVGWWTNTRYGTFDVPGRGQVEGVAGHYHISEAAPWLRSLVSDSFKRGNPSLLGYSIVADGQTKVLREATTRRPFQDVMRIDSVESVDPVVNPAAGGVALRLVASKEGSSMDWTKLTLAEAVRGLATGSILPDDIKQHRPDLSTLLEAGRIEDATEAPAAAPAAPATDVAALVEAAIAPIKTSAYVASKLAERKLPEVAASRIREAVAGKAFTEAEVDGMIQAEADYLAKINPALVKDAGPLNVTDMKSERERVTESVVDMLSGKSHDSIKALYVDLTGDRSFSGKLQESGRLTEAIISTTFGEIMGDSITRQMLAVYQQPGLDEWRKIAQVNPARDFRTNRRIRMGGYANLPAVAQDGAYVALTTPADEEATFAVTKRGGIETLTMEAIVNDDLAGLRQIPVRLGRAAAQTLHEFAFDFLAGNAAIYDTVALFHASHGSNLGSAALDATSLAAGRLAMLKQAEAGSSKRLGIAPKFLVVPLDLEQSAYQLTATDREVGSANNTLNFARTFGLSIITVPYWTDANNWFLVADKAQVPTIEIGFLNGQEDPELFLQDQPTNGNVFSNDKLTYKIRHIYGGAVLDFRGFYGAIVA